MFSPKAFIRRYSPCYLAEVSQRNIRKLLWRCLPLPPPPSSLPQTACSRAEPKLSVLNALAVSFSELALHHVKLFNLPTGDTIQSSPSKLRTRTFSSAGLWWIPRDAVHIVARHAARGTSFLTSAILSLPVPTSGGASFHTASKIENTSASAGSTKKVKQVNRARLLVRV